MKTEIKEAIEVLHKNYGEFSLARLARTLIGKVNLDECSEKDTDILCAYAPSMMLYTVEFGTGTADVKIPFETFKKRCTPVIEFFANTKKMSDEDFEYFKKIAKPFSDENIKWFYEKYLDDAIFYLHKQD